MATSYGTIPKGLRKLLDDPRVDEVGEEGEDGYWVYLVQGWCWDPGTHIVHEYTVKDVLREFAKISKCERGCECEWDTRPGYVRPDREAGYD